MKKPRPIIAYAVVNSNNPKFDVFELYKDTDVVLNKGETLCKVQITLVKNEKTI